MLQSAVVREGLRLSYGVTTRLPRVAHEEIQYKEYTIPAGVCLPPQRPTALIRQVKLTHVQTPVSETPYFVLMHPSIFPDPSTFKPERWLDPAAKDKKLDRYLVSFGKGSRQCLGMK